MMSVTLPPNLPLSKKRANPDEEQGLHEKMAALTLDDLPCAMVFSVIRSSSP